MSLDLDGLFMILFRLNFSFLIYIENFLRLLILIGNVDLVLEL